MKNPTLLKEMLHYRGRDEMPDDFDAFWNQYVRRFANWHSADLNFKYGVLNKLVELSVC